MVATYLGEQSLLTFVQASYVVGNEARKPPKEVVAMRLSRRGVVVGPVQGVFCQSSMAQQALRLAIYDWVKNTAKNQVEFLISGEEAAVTEMINWVWRAPLLARVGDVQLSPSDAPSEAKFTIIRR